MLNQYSKSQSKTLYKKIKTFTYLNLFSLYCILKKRFTKSETKKSNLKVSIPTC